MSHFPLSPNPTPHHGDAEGISPPPPILPRPFHKQLYFWVLVAVALGVIYGVLFPSNPTPPQQLSALRWAEQLQQSANGFSRALGRFLAAFPLGESLKPLGDGFVSLIKMVIAPIVFSTVVGGIASVGDLRKVGRVGIKALVYFELVTTLAMLIALAVVHAAKPGEGVVYQPTAVEVKRAESYKAVGEKQSAVDIFLHVIPETAVSAFAEGNILQVLLVSILVGAALAKMGERAQPLIHLIRLLAQTFFHVVGFIVKLAPLAAFGAMASTVGGSGIKALVALLKMMGCFYASCLLFIFAVLGAIAFFNGFSLIKYLRCIKEEILLVLGTSSSESALAPLIAKLERLGCSGKVVGIVLPAGYSFNLDGTSLYLAMAIVFLSQATNTPLSLGQEFGLLGLLLLTSKGAAAVTGGGFITLTATLASTHNTALLAGLALLVGIDRFMSEARAITNLIGNGLATFIIAKSEGELDESKAAEVLRHPPAIPLSEKTRDTSFIAVR
jgi:aerobic C4-dicarboxylate transport protein